LIRGDPVANLTIVVPDDALRQARLRAVGDATSVNAVLREFLIRYAGGDARQQGAAERILALSRAVGAAAGGK
jgi:hypothetical protein